MSEENKKPSNDNSGLTRPIPEINKLPDLAAIIEKAENSRNWDNTVEGRILEIFDKGHTGIPPQRPIEKNDEKK